LPQTVTGASRVIVKPFMPAIRSAIRLAPTTLSPFVQRTASLVRSRVIAARSRVGRLTAA
jgi:hypothetical protein